MVLENISLFDYEEEIREGLREMYGGVLDVELKVKKLKLRDIIYIDGLILVRKYKNIWKIMNDEYFFDLLLLFFVNIEIKERIIFELMLNNMLEENYEKDIYGFFNIVLFEESSCYKLSL